MPKPFQQSVAEVVKTFGVTSSASRCTRAPQARRLKVYATIALLLFASTCPATEPNSAKLSFEHPANTGSSNAIHLRGTDARWQLQVTQSQLAAENAPSGGAISNSVALPDSQDVTRTVKIEIKPAIAEVDPAGYLRPLTNGEASIQATDAAGNVAQIALKVTGLDATQPVNFANQVVPIFTKMGCNGGGCHGKAAGQAGFKLSLLGFEPKEDYEHLVRESRGRRLFPAVPDKSLLLQKAINASPHGGGQRMEADTHEYRLLKRWIASGMPYGSEKDPVLTEIEMLPKHRRLQREATQQLAVIARYSDGSVEDITHTVQYESNNKDLAEVDEHGLVSLRDQSGVVSVMARYQGQVAVFQASIPLGEDISESAWPPTRNLVDELVFTKLKSLGIPPSAECDDPTFIRRVTLDLAGRLPQIEETRAFLADQSTDKHEKLVERLLASSDHAEFFARKWVTILRNRRANAGYQFGNFAFHDWLRSSFHQNKPYDELVRELLTATGAVESNPPVAWFREVNNTEARVEDAAQLFLGQRMQCARCHHHPFEKWSQRDYFQMAAFFSKVQKKNGDTPEEPIFVSRFGGASARHPKTGENLKPAGLDAAPLDLNQEADPRESLVDWMVAPENPFFARSLVNRYWKHFFATGMVEPEDDMRVTNPPSNVELLDGLSQHFINSGYDIRKLLHLICTSSAYRLSSSANEYNLRDNNSYSRFYPKRLQSEVLLDAVDQVAMTQTTFAGLPNNTRAVSLPDTSYKSYFMDVFGSPDSATACECERSNEATLAQSLHLLNSKEVQQKLAQDTGRAASLAASSGDPTTLIEELYLTALSRKPNADELLVATQYLSKATPEGADPAKARRAAFEDLVWAMLNTKEFLFNH